MKKSLVLMLCIATASPIWGGLPINYIPSSYRLELAPDDEDTLLVRTCDGLVAGLPDRCRLVAKMSVADMEAFAKEMEEAGELAELAHDVSLIGTGLFFGGFLTAIIAPPPLVRNVIKRLGLPVIGVLAGVTALAGGVGAIMQFLFSPGSYDLDSMNIGEHEVKSMFTEFLNQHGEAVEAD